LTKRIFLNIDNSLFRKEEKSENLKMGYATTDSFFKRPNPVLTTLILVTFLYLFPAISFWPEYLPAGNVLSWLVQGPML
jgi:hypothetical protein